uniref:Uncharacterized protein n=1 Tax=Arundo donax TaxID=35708 RepID=A0A0A9EJA0_ARUDO
MSRIWRRPSTWCSET